MTIYRTCHNCTLAKLACARRESIQTDIKGLGITSLKFTCTDRKPLFERGQRVSVTWPVADDDDEYNNSYTLESWPATVIRESGSRFLISVDDALSDFDTPARSYVKNASLYARVPAERLALSGERSKSLCDACDGVCGDDGRFPACHGYEGYRPQKCAQP